LKKFWENFEKIKDRKNWGELSEEKKWYKSVLSLSSFEVKPVIVVECQSQFDGKIVLLHFFTFFGDFSKSTQIRNLRIGCSVSGRHVRNSTEFSRRIEENPGEVLMDAKSQTKIKFNWLDKANDVFPVSDGKMKRDDVAWSLSSTICFYTSKDLSGGGIRCLGSSHTDCLNKITF